MIDILICSVPSGIINRPPAAPALLKACVVAAGHTARTVDFSLELYTTQCKSNFDIYTKVCRNFEPYTEWQSLQHIETWLDQCLQTIADYDPAFVAFSVFSDYQHRATILLCEAVRQSFPNIKIVLGGYGLGESCINTFDRFRPLTGIEKLGKFSDYVQQHNLADHLIFGEGEQQLVDVLNGCPFDNSAVDLNALPISNFDDYKLDQYLWHSEPVLTVTGSKGCVRNCTFCNVPSKFGRYRRKSGLNVAQELIALSQKYNIHKFEFTDSLVNGSQKDFVEFVTELAKYNQTAERPLTWYGQYICRSQKQIPKNMYSLMKQSGAVHLIIGAESGSDAVLEAMNKNISVKDVFDELDQFQRHGLQAQILMLVGYYNETYERFLESLKFIAQCHRYLAAGVLSRIAVGLPLIIEPNGYLHMHSQELGIITDPNNVYNWRVATDHNNTWLERIRRKLIMQAMLRQMNVSITGNGIAELRDIIEQLKAYEHKLRSSCSSRDPISIES
jgi:hypothetical protein